MQRRAAIYCRISKDRSGEALGVARQLELCEKRAAEKSWSVVGEPLIDNDMSASKGKPRPEFTRLLEGLRAGVYDAVVTYSFDRLTRHPAELEELITAIEDAKALVESITGGLLDLSTPTGRLGARIFGNVAIHETELKRERQLAESRQAAREGKPHMGGSRPYGYEQDKVTIREDEAFVLRECARCLLDESVTVRATLNRLKAEGKCDPKLRVNVILGDMKNPRYIGYRMRHGEMHSTKAWDPIFTLDVWNRLQSEHYGGREVKASDGQRVWMPGKSEGHKKSVNRALLTGLCWCDHCAGAVRTNSKGSYVCEERDLSINAEYLEARVSEEAIRTRAEMDRAITSWHERRGELLPDEAAMERAVEDVERRLAKLDDLYLTSDMNRERYDGLLAPLLSEAAEARMSLSQFRTRELQAPTDGDRERLSEWFHSETTNDDQRRKLIQTAVTKVIVRRSGEAWEAVTEVYGDEWDAVPGKKALVMRHRVEVVMVTEDPDRPLFDAGLWKRLRWIADEDWDARLAKEIRRNRPSP
jgi:DNA invertase Pin-like site-specific DNA recombinase